MVPRLNSNCTQEREIVCTLGGKNTCSTSVWRNIPLVVQKRTSICIVRTFDNIPTCPITALSHARLETFKELNTAFQLARSCESSDPPSCPNQRKRAVCSASPSKNVFFCVFREEGVVAPRSRSSCTHKRITSAGTSVLWVATSAAQTSEEKTSPSHVKTHSKKEDINELKMSQLVLLRPAPHCCTPSKMGESANAATTTQHTSKNSQKHPNLRVQMKQNTARLTAQTRNFDKVRPKEKTATPGNNGNNATTTKRLAFPEVTCEHTPRIPAVFIGKFCNSNFPKMHL